MTVDFDSRYLSPTATPAVLPHSSIFGRAGIFEQAGILGQPGTVCSRPISIRILAAACQAAQRLKEILSENFRLAGVDIQELNKSLVRILELEDLNPGNDKQASSSELESIRQAKAAVEFVFRYLCNKALTDSNHTASLSFLVSVASHEYRESGPALLAQIHADWRNALVKKFCPEAASEKNAKCAQ